MKMKVRFSERHSVIDVDFDEVNVVTKILDETYDGEYEVTPKVEAQKLATKEKFMYNDVTVYAIPYFDVSNTSGGTTVYIGEEIEYGN